MERIKDDGVKKDRQNADLEQELLRSFLGKAREVPERPPYSRTSTLIIRKELLPFYYAIYDHDRSRFIELQYRLSKTAPLLSIRVPEGLQPPPDTTA